MNREEIVRYGNRLLELEKLDIVQEYIDVLHKVVHYQQEEPTREYYKSSKKYDYYIVNPYEEFCLLRDGKYGFKKYSYDAIGKNKDKKSALYLGLGLCNLTKKEIIDRIDKRIQKDNAEVEE